MRAAVPAEAMDCLRAVLRDAFGPAAPPIVDLRDAIPDRMFHDEVHEKREGRVAATRLLIEALGSTHGAGEAGAWGVMSGSGWHQDSQTFHGACPDVQRPSRSLRSRRVSMHCQNSPWR